MVIKNSYGCKVCRRKKKVAEASRSSGITVRIIALLTLFASVMLFSSNFASAGLIGISPGNLKFSEVLQGGYAQGFVSIDVDSPNSSVQTRIVSDDNISSWITINDGNPIYVSSNQTNLEKIVIQPPKDARIGNYTARITFLVGGSGSISGSSGSILKTAIEVLTTIQVTGKEHLSCTASAIQVDSAEVNSNSAVHLRILNNGNVRVNPSVYVDIYDKWQDKKLKTLTFSTPDILPTAEYVFDKNFAPDLPADQYWAQVRVPQCYSQALTDFSVLQAGQIEDNGELLAIRNPPWVFEKDFVQIQPIFQNTGKTAVNAHFEGIVKQGNTIVGQLKSDTIKVDPKQQQSLDVVYQPKDPGRYIISGKVIYNNKVTGEKQSLLNVKPASSKHVNVILIIGIVLGYLLVLAAGIYLILMFRRRRLRGKR